ncbi:MAG TPA: COX15/CtaA family protein, partial [Vicinamibacteria bacterium]|nr:COX15/CtaA family protein [Vicinamibacteria bacterium]
LSLGRVIPPLDSLPVAIHFAHRVGALVVLVAVLVLALRGARSRDPRFARPALGLLGVVFVQIALGAATVLSGRAVLPTTAHVMTGALVLGGAFFLALRAFCPGSRPRDPAAAPPALDRATVQP